MSNDPWATPYSQPVAPRERLHLTDVWAAVVTTAVVVLFGAPVGMLWGAISPRVEVRKVADGIDLIMPETKAFIGGDGSFFVITVLVGIALGVAAALLARRHGPGVAVGLAVGSVLAAIVAAKVGVRIGYDEYVALRDVAAVNTEGHYFLKLRAEGVLLGWPVAALLTLLTVTAAMRPPLAPSPIPPPLSR